MNSAPNRKWSIPRLSVENPVFANLLMAAIVIAGSYAYLTLPRELTPDVSFQLAQIRTVYPAASPEEVESLVTVPIEEAVQADVSNIDLMTSFSSEGLSVVTIQFEEMSDRDFDREMRLMRDAVANIDDLPEEVVDAPKIIEINSSFEAVATVVVGGAASESETIELAEEIEADLMKIQGVSDVRTSGLREREIWVAVDPERLSAYRLSLQDISLALRRQNLNVPAGPLEVGALEYSVRALAQFQSIQDIENAVVRSLPSGEPLRVGDVAKVSDAFEKPRTLSRLNGKRAVSLDILKTNDGNTIRLVKLVREYAANRQADLPQNVEMSVVNDSSVILRERLGILQNNALFGLALVALLLYALLGWRNALFACLGIPVAFMAAFLFLYWSGGTINAVALFGLILVVGIVVDDAIVVIENIFRYVQEGLPPKEAAIRGAEEIGSPVLAASLTTIAAFAPLMLLSGVTGQFMRIVPMVAIIVLSASLLEVFVILPSHAAEWGRPPRLDSSGRPRRQRWFDALRRGYTRILARVIRHRYAALGVTLLVGAAATAAAFSILPRELFPGEDFPQVNIRIETPTSYSLQQTGKTISAIEAVAMELSEEERLAVTSRVGLHSARSNLDSPPVRPNVGEVSVELTPKNERRRSVDEIVDDLRGKIALIAEIETLSVDKALGGPPSGKDVDVKVIGSDFEQMRAVSKRLQDALREMPGVYEIQDDYLVGRNELQIDVNKEKARALGLDAALIAQTARAALAGVVSTTYRDADESPDIVVKYAPEALKSPEDLGNIMIEASPLRDVAEIRMAQGLAEIRRFEGERSIAVTASIVDGMNDPVSVNKALQASFAEFSGLYPDVSLDFRGVFDQINESFSEIGKLFIVGIIAIYVILGAQLKSFIEPFVVMFAAPFGIIGAMLGLLAIQATLSIVALFGVVALSGIVVNDSIVLMDFIKKGGERGMGKFRAALAGGKARFRPVLLTSVTTIAGLTPMAMGIGGKSPIWIPIASVIIFGLAASTLLTLFLIPALHVMTVDLREFMKKRA